MICDGCTNNDEQCTLENIDICRAHMSVIKYEEEYGEEEEE